MPSYSFKERFVPFVKDFTKRQTIRGIRKYPACVGSIISHFTGSRFKPVRIIDAQICISVDTIFILEDGTVYIDEGKVLTDVEAQFAFDNPGVFQLMKKPNKWQKDLLAWQDGFRYKGCETSYRQYHYSFDLMITFWKETNTLPFAGHIIKW